MDMYRALVSAVLSIGIGLNVDAAIFAQLNDGGSQNDVDFFESKIRPVLIKHCYECHAGSSEDIKGGLRVDWAGGLATGGDSGPAIEPGKPEESLLLSALEFEDIEMPPSGKLPAEVIDNFRKWITSGAHDPRKEEPPRTPTKPKHQQMDASELWSFQPIRKVEVPATKQNDWPAGSIDRFVLARLEQAGIRPIEDADLGTLVRRVTFDLTGLPPTADTVRRLAADPSSFNYLEYVNSLLDSQEFGEHWARHWLDIARYADSNGGDFNATFHDAWRYRNYVIDAFNHDKPFDRFIVEQIAGDLLPAASDAERTEQMVASGFLMLGAKMLSERNKNKLQMDVVDEQIGIVGTAFMGLTLGCARCHDHKFDPVSTRDYYAMAGIFKSTHVLEGEIQKYVSNWIKTPLPISSEQQEQIERYQASLKSLKDKIAATEKRIKSLDGQAADAKSQGVVLDDPQAELVGNWKRSTLTKPFVGDGYIHDDGEEKGEKSVAFRTRLPKRGQYEVRVSYVPGGNRADNVPVTITHARGINEVAVNQQLKPKIDKLFMPIGTFTFDSEKDAIVSIATAGTVGYVIVDAVQFVPVEELEATTNTTTATVPPKEATSASVSKERTPDAASKNEEASGKSEDSPESEELIAARKELEALQAKLKEFEKQAPPAAPMALAARDAKEIVDAAICIRGEAEQLGDVVPRGFIKPLEYDVSPEFSKQSSGRLEMARWIADARHPLTSRVLVNRVWKNLMGEGIVPSVDNFGALGEKPSHPELLDYLATEFTGHGWSTKWLVRQIVCSHAYRLASRSDETCEAVDPENMLLWRANRKRLSAEAIRDALLASTGTLDRTRAESPVAGLGTLVTLNNATETGFNAKSGLHRTIYEPIIRNELPSIMRVFDFADPDVATGGRAATTVPAQALWMLNGPMVHDQAQELARLALDKENGLDERIEFLYVQALGRLPTYSELKIAREFVSSRDKNNTDSSALSPDDKSNQLNLANDSDKKTAVADKPEQRDRWTDLAHAIFAASTFRLND